MQTPALFLSLHQRTGHLSSHYLRPHLHLISLPSYNTRYRLGKSSPSTQDGADEIGSWTSLQTMSSDTTPSVYQRHSFNPRPDGRPRFPSSFTPTKVEPFVPTQSKRIPIIDAETEIDITLSSPPMIKSTQRREVVEVNVPASRWRSRDCESSV